jgi:hypothetical protein
MVCRELLGEIRFEKKMAEIKKRGGGVYVEPLVWHQFFRGQCTLRCWRSSTGYVGNLSGVCLKTPEMYSDVFEWGIKKESISLLLLRPLVTQSHTCPYCSPYPAL